MPVTTTNTIEGRRIAEYRGLVAGEAILGANGSMLMVSVPGTAVVTE